MAEVAEEAGEAEAVEAAVAAVVVTDEVATAAVAMVEDEVPTSPAPTPLLFPTPDGRLTKLHRKWYRLIDFQMNEQRTNQY